MAVADLEAVVALQKACFPDPFPEELLWSGDHLRRHIDIFPAGQFVAVAGGQIAGSASNTRISEANFQAHRDWESTVGGPFLSTFDPDGTTLYGLDISIHPQFRRKGVGRRIYEERFRFVRENGLVRYATGCRLPDFGASGLDLATFLKEVEARNREDRTLTPLLRYGLTLVGGIENYMEDEESRNCAALLEWRP